MKKELLKKYGLRFLNLGLIIVIILFSFNIFAKFFFNKFLIKTPNLKSLKFEQAAQILKKNGLKINIIGQDYSALEKDKIYSQFPPAGRKIKKGRTINIWVSKGKNSLKIPDIQKMDLLDGKIQLEQLGLKIGNISYVNHKYDYNQIISLDPPALSPITKGGKVSMLVSLNKRSKNVRMPDLSGLTVEDARQQLASLRLKVGSVKYVRDTAYEPGTVIDTNIKPYQKIPIGTSIRLIVIE